MFWACNGCLEIRSINVLYRRRNQRHAKGLHFCTLKLDDLPSQDPLVVRITDEHVAKHIALTQNVAHAAATGNYNKPVF